MSKKWIATAALGLLAVFPAWAATLTFEDLAAGTVLSDQYAAQGVSFSANLFSGPGTSTSGQPWATNTDMTLAASAGSDVGSLGLPSLVSGNVLRSSSGWTGETGDPSFLMTFSTPVSSVSMDFAGVFEPADVTLWAYDGGELLGAVSGTAAGQFTLSFAADEITSVAVRPGTYNDWVGVDNIEFAPVPEPRSHEMSAAAVALLGAAMRAKAGAGSRRRGLGLARSKP